MSVLHHRRPLLGTAVVTVLAIEFLRVLLPTALQTLPERSGVPIAATAGLVLLPAVLGGSTVLFAGRWSPRTMAAVGSAIAVIARAGLALANDPAWLLMAAVAGATATTAALVGVAAASPTGRGARTGIVAGLGAEACLRAATDGAGLVWGTSLTDARVLIWLLVAALVLRRLITQLDRPDERTATPPAWAWWTLLPVFVLHPILLTSPGRIATATGWQPRDAVLTIALAQALLVLAAASASRLPPNRAAPLGAGLLLVGTAGAIPAAGWPGVLAPLAAAAGLGLLAGFDTGARSGDHPLTRARTAACALIASTAVVLLYYLRDLVGLPGNNRWLLLLTAAVGVGMALRGARTTPPVRARLEPRHAVRGLSLAAAVVAATTLVVPPLPDTESTPPAQGFVTIATMNVRNGFDPAGQYRPTEQVRALRDAGVDIVVLQEVDRGWWAYGGQDQLPTIVRGLGLPFHRFARAADEVHGHAIVSRYPIVEFTTDRLPRAGEHTTRGQLGAVVDLPGSQPLGIVATQLSPTAPEARLTQARAVAGTVARLRERAVPTVLLGDMGASTDDAAVESFTALLRDALPDDLHTYPSWDPDQRRSHILLSPDLRGTGARLLQGSTSSHLPVLLEIVRVPVRT